MLGLDAPSSRELKKKFQENFNKNISHTTNNNILNKSLSKSLKVVNIFLLKNFMRKKGEFAKFILEIFFLLTNVE